MRLISTYTSYQLITRDIERSLNRVQKQPLVERDTKYYLENITKVKSIEEFVSNTRLFNYAMKAHGLADMAYAKAFMKKVLTEGIKEPNSFANKLTDKRYAEFAKTYNFAAYGQDAAIYNPTQQTTAMRYQLEAVKAGVLPTNPILIQQTKDYLAGIKKITSIDEFLANDDIYAYALKAWGLAEKLGDKQFIRKVLEGGVADPASFANKQTDGKWASFATAFNFAELGEKTTTYNPAQHRAVDMYLRQTLEENAGAQNEGVRLALYFQRKAPTLKNAYQVLSDPALGKVVRTALGLPESMAQADVDQQAKLLAKRIDFKDFEDPEKLGKFLARFSAMWELNNRAPAAVARTAGLFSQPAQFGLSTDALLALQQLRK
jgi:hypothetical protein